MHEQKHPTTTAAAICDCKTLSAARVLGGTAGLRYSYALSNGMEVAFKQSEYAKLDARHRVSGDGGHREVALVGRYLTDRTTAGFRNTIGTTPSSIYAYTDGSRSVAVQVRFRN